MSPPKCVHNVSIIWKAIVLSFPLVGMLLVWGVVNGENVWVGSDPWVGSGDSLIWSNKLNETLQ